MNFAIAFLYNECGLLLYEQTSFVRKRQNRRIIEVLRNEEDLNVTVSNFKLALANFIQNRERVSIEKCESNFFKSSSTIKRSLYELNAYLPEDKTFLITNYEIVSRISYNDFLTLCSSIDINDYMASSEERVTLVVVTSFLKGYVNLTHLYDQLNVSLSTKKNDRKQLEKVVKNESLKVINLRRKGITIQGNEQLFRMYVAGKLLSIVELDEKDEFTARRANTPIQQLMYEMFAGQLFGHGREVGRDLSVFFKNKQTTTDYASKKFLAVYYAISLIRIKKGLFLTFDQSLLPPVEANELLDDDEESRYLDYLIASLNYKQSLNFPYHETYDELCQYLIELFEKQLKLKFYTHDELFRHLYAYLYKCSIKNHLGYFFYDHKFEDIYQEMPDLIEMLKQKTGYIRKFYGMSLSELQLSDICLIIAAYILKNRLADSKQKKIVVITNSAAEKMLFFVENLKQYVAFEMVHYLTINELHLLKHMNYDFILVFSNRIRSKLSEYGYQAIKLNYYLRNDDIKVLLDHGFSSNRNSKLLAERFAEEIQNVPKKSLVSFLKKHYPDYFI